MICVPAHFEPPETAKGRTPTDGSGGLAGVAGCFSLKEQVLFFFFLSFPFRGSALQVLLLSAPVQWRRRNDDKYLKMGCQRVQRENGHLAETHAVDAAREEEHQFGFVTAASI